MTPLDEARQRIEALAQQQRDAAARNTRDGYPKAADRARDRAAGLEQALRIVEDCGRKQ